MLFVSQKAQYVVFAQVDGQSTELRQIMQNYVQPGKIVFREVKIVLNSVAVKDIQPIQDVVDKNFLKKEE